MDSQPNSTFKILLKQTFLKYLNTVMEQPFVLDEVKRCVGERIMSSFGDVGLRRAELGNMAGLWGASSLAERAVLRENGD